MSKKMLTVREIAETISVTEWAVRQWVRQGKVPGAVKFGNSIRIPESFLHGGTGEEGAQVGTDEAETGLPPALDYDPRDEWPTVEPEDLDSVPEPIEPPQDDQDDEEN